ncbi:MAG TPA: type I-C CRISPR-associated protein Cas5 [Methanoregulaceae archaeon]|nr:type I-C CRISPR-associated protein Cas5 [Methanoregulaceae archaeon]
MGFGITLRVRGDYACFTRPEMKAERVSYDVITPSAARGILEAIYWKPAIVWRIDRIHVLNPIRFDTVRRNEVSSKISTRNVVQAMRGGEVALGLNASDSAERVQRASYLLRDVDYCIEAHFDMTDRAGPEDTPEKHYNVALRRMRKGQCFHHPYLGCREFPTRFDLVDGPVPRSHYEGQTVDLGFMLHDIDFANEMTPVFFRATMRDGVIDCAECLRAGAIS